MPEDFFKVTHSNTETTYYQISTIPTPMQATIHQIFNCSYSGSTGRLYLEGKAMELIAGKLAQLESCRNKRDSETTLRPDDIERIYYARELLVHDLEHPPRLIELARSVGLTHNKLTVGFREVFETTPFNYLRDMRICKAKLLLDEGMMNVTEAAVFSRILFSQPFRQGLRTVFWIAPGTYLRETNKNRVFKPVGGECPPASSYHNWSETPLMRTIYL